MAWAVCGLEWMILPKIFGAVWISKCTIQLLKIFVIYNGCGLGWIKLSEVRLACIETVIYKFNES